VAERDHPADGTLILLHGHDDEPEACARTAAHLAPDGFAIVVPTGALREDDRASWWQNDADGVPDAAQVEAALAHIDELINEHARSNTPVIVAGFSQGAALALLWALRDSAAVAQPTSATGNPSDDRVDHVDHVDHVDGLVAVAGWLPTVDGVELDPAACRARRVLIAHGTDDEVVPLPLGRATARLLERHHREVTFVEREAGHDLEAFVDDVRAWISARR